MDEGLLTFFKALADANRLKIIGLLAQKPHSVEELSAILDLRPSTISHHLGKLAEAGLVSARAVSYYNIYQLEQEKMDEAARKLLTQGTFQAAAPENTENAYADKVWRDFLTPDGRLKTIPAQQKKLVIILRRLAQEFVPGMRYPEKQVNDILRAFHDDTASLRRELVGYRLLERDHGEYWRVEETDNERTEPE
jgi:DNA-binding transcriptional ArsR family regulator